MLAPAAPLEYDLRARYRVTTKALNPRREPVEIYEGTNRDRAVEAANFWDERGDPWMDVTPAPIGALQVALFKFAEQSRRLTGMKLS